MRAQDEEPTGKKIHEGDVGAPPKDVERTDIRNNIRHQLEDAGLEPDSMDAQLRHQAVEDKAEAANFDEPALLDEDEMLYKDQELAEMEGYQPEYGGLGRSGRPLPVALPALGRSQQRHEVELSRGVDGRGVPSRGSRP